MATEIWRWQGGTDVEDRLYGLARVGDGSILVGGTTEASWFEDNAGSEDFVAVKLDGDGGFQWGWQEGELGLDSVNHAVATGDGAAVLIGNTNGDWAGPSAGSEDFAVAKIHSNGTVLWRWQDGSSSYDFLFGGTLMSSGSIFCVGGSTGDWYGTNEGQQDSAGVMLSTTGEELWRWMEGTDGEDTIRCVAAGAADTLIIGGYTEGSAIGSNAGGVDVWIAKLDDQGDAIWSLQDGTSGDDYVHGCVVTSDGSIYLVGHTDGDWNGQNTGSYDFIALKLDTDGNELWRWQGGTSSIDVLYTAAELENGDIITAGSTSGDWSSSNAGSSDLVLLRFDPDGNFVWDWQDGTANDDWFTEVAAGDDGAFVAAGNMGVNSDNPSSGSSTPFVVIGFDTGFPTPAPAANQPVSTPEAPASSPSTSSSSAELNEVIFICGILLGAVVVAVFLVVCLLCRRAGTAKKQTPLEGSHQPQPTQLGTNAPSAPSVSTAPSARWQMPPQLPSYRTLMASRSQR